MIRYPRKLPPRPFVYSAKAMYCGVRAVSHAKSDAEHVWKCQSKSTKQNSNCDFAFEAKL
jgi:hypothetical protein